MANWSRPFRGLAFDAEGLAKASFADHRLIVAHDPLRAAEQGDARRTRFTELEAMAKKIVSRLDAQDAGATAQGRRASNRGGYSRFTRAVAEAEMTRFLKARGFAASEIRTGLAVDAQHASGVLISDRITETDILDGRWDNAAVGPWRVKWADTSQRVLLRRGAVGQIRRGRMAFVAEVRSLAHVLGHLSHNLGGKLIQPVQVPPGHWPFAAIPG